jgi:Patatin-like phospholipase
MPRQYLLSIDGGGIRGIIPAIALAKLEDTTGKLTRDTFSFVAGTSTGAIIAAGVAAGVPRRLASGISTLPGPGRSLPPTPGTYSSGSSKARCTRPRNSLSFLSCAGSISPAIIS